MKLCVKKKEAINVKGISYPVQTYEVTGFSDKSKNLIEKNIPGLSLSFDLSEIEDDKHAIELVSQVLRNLKKKD